MSGSSLWKLVGLVSGLAAVGVYLASPSTRSVSRLHDTTIHSAEKMRTFQVREARRELDTAKRLDMSGTYELEGLMGVRPKDEAQRKAQDERQKVMTAREQLRQRQDLWDERIFNLERERDRAIAQAGSQRGIYLVVALLIGAFAVFGFVMGVGKARAEQVTGSGETTSSRR